MIRGRIFSEMIRIHARKPEFQAESRSYRPKVKERFHLVWEIPRSVLGRTVFFFAEERSTNIEIKCVQVLLSPIQPKGPHRTDKTMTLRRKTMRSKRSAWLGPLGRGSYSRKGVFLPFWCLPLLREKNLLLRKEPLSEPFLPLKPISRIKTPSKNPS